MQEGIIYNIKETFFTSPIQHKILFQSLIKI